MSRDKKTISIRNRMLAFALVFLVVTAGLTARLFYWQILKGNELKTRALDQQTKEKEITPKRGTIYDRNGKELAVSATVDTITADPNIIKKTGNAEDVANTLSEILGEDKDKILEIITRESHFEWVAKKIDAGKSAQIRKYITGKDANGKTLSGDELKGHNLAGISLVEDSKRYYPGGNLAAHVIGFTGTDNQGLEGIEAIYDNYLKGSSGKIVTSSKSSGTLPADYEKYYGARDGDNIILTIDSNLQYFAEKALDEAYLEHKAAGGACVLITNPNTGEVLAMATRPTFDLNAPRAIFPDRKTPATIEELQARWRNKVVVDTYEPGSVFKLITCAIALEEKASALSDYYYCPGYTIVGGEQINCFRTSGHGDSNLLKGTVDSCNPVFMAVAEKLGRERMYKYFKAFGFRETTGFDLPGEAIGSYWNFNDYNETELATSSFGQGFTVTPLQMASAVGALVNGGYLYKPYIVKEIVDSEGNVIQATTPTRIRQVISEDTSDTMRYVMQTTLIESGSLAKVSGYDVGGKSGTSEKLPRGNNQYIGSYCSVAPINDPQLLCLVIVDDPRGESYYGGQVAAPAASKIMEQALKYYKIQPNDNSDLSSPDDTVVPNVMGKSAKDAQSLISSFNLQTTIKGDGEVVIFQDPAPGTHAHNNSYVTITLGEEDEESPEVRMPDVTGKTLDEVNKIITDSGLKLTASGVSSDSSVVSTGQYPAPGAIVERGATVSVSFSKSEENEDEE